MKKFPWIIVLLLALSLTFWGCKPFGNDRDDDVDDPVPTKATVYLNNGAAYIDGVYTLSGGSLASRKELIIVYDHPIEDCKVEFIFISDVNADIIPTNTALDFTSEDTDYGNKGCDNPQHNKPSPFTFTTGKFADSMKLAASGNNELDFEFSGIAIKINGKPITLIEEGENYPNHGILITTTANDFTYDGFSQSLENGTIKSVTITPKTGIGAVSNIRYEGLGDTTYLKSAVVPKVVGKYQVTFDALASEDGKYSAAADLEAPIVFNITLKSDDIIATTAADFSYANFQQDAGSASSVTILPKTGVGAVSNIQYEGTASTNYSKSANVPQAAGTYQVTFDAAATSTHSAASGLEAPVQLVLEALNTTSADFTYSNFSQSLENGTIKSVTITPKTGVGTVSNIYYEGTGGTTYSKSTYVPQAKGKYQVTFDAAATSTYEAANSLEAPQLLNVTLTNDEILATTTADFIYANFQQDAGSASSVTITPRTDVGAVSNIQYEGAAGTSYSKSADVPQAAGTYQVTFDAAATSTHEAASGLEAPVQLVLEALNTTSADFTYSNFSQSLENGTIKSVTITPKTYVGAVSNIYYEGTGGTTYSKSTNVPQAVGKYKVTFDAAATEIYAAAAGLEAPQVFNITSTNDEILATTAADFIYANFQQDAGSASSVTITPRTGVGAVSNIQYEGVNGTSYSKSADVPQAAGTYQVTFDAAATSTHSAASGLTAPSQLVVNIAAATSDDFTYYNFSQDAGEVIDVVITPKTSDIGAVSNVQYEGVNGTSYSKSTNVPQAVGSYQVTFDAAATTTHSAAYGLAAPNLVVNVTNTTNQDFNYDLFTQTAGSVTNAAITPKPGIGAVSNVQYEGVNGTSYSKSADVPQTAGEYRVTFNAAASADGSHREANGLTAPMLLTVSEEAIPNIVMTSFTDLDAADSSFATYIAGEGWFFYGKPTGSANVLFNIGSEISTDKYSKVIIEGLADSTNGVPDDGFHVKLKDADGDDIQTAQLLTFTNGKVEIALTFAPGSTVNQISFENIAGAGKVADTLDRADSIDSSGVLGETVGGLLGVVGGLLGGLIPNGSDLLLDIDRVTFVARE